MKLEEIAEHLSAAQQQLEGRSFVPCLTMTRDGKTVTVGITARFLKAVRQAGFDRSPRLYSALRNAGYGLDRARPRSRAGRDGVYLLDRSFRPVNEMMAKIYDRYLDRDGSGASGVAKALGVALTDLQAVRVVAHGIRLIGVRCETDGTERIVLVDCERGR